MTSVFRPLGGRGKKETYQTKVIRVPVPLIPLIDVLHERFYCCYSDGLIDDGLTQDDLTNRLGLVIVEKSELVSISQEVLTAKKSAKITIQKLLQVLTGDKDLTLSPRPVGYVE